MKRLGGYFLGFGLVLLLVAMGLGAGILSALPAVIFGVLGMIAQRQLHLRSHVVDAEHPASRFQRLA